MNHDGTYRLLHLPGRDADWIQLEPAGDGVRIVLDLNDREVAKIKDLSNGAFEVCAGKSSQIAGTLDQAHDIARSLVRQGMYNVE